MIYNIETINLTKITNLTFIYILKLIDKIKVLEPAKIQIFKIGQQILFYYEIISLLSTSKRLSAFCEPKNFLNILAGSNGRSKNSNLEQSTYLHPEGQERVSVILVNRSVIVGKYDAIFPWDNYLIWSYKIFCCCYISKGSSGFIYFL